MTRKAEPGVKRSKYPFPSSKAASAVMRANRKTDTRPEVRLRAELHRRGYRFRKNLSIRVEGRCRRPDIVFPARRLAIFIDGCFWHRCPEHGSIPRSNQDYWLQKLIGNSERDTADVMAFGKAGWAVIRIWEHTGVKDAADQIVDAWASMEPKSDSRRHRRPAPS